MEYREYWNDVDISSQGFDVEEFLKSEQRSEEERLEQELQRLESLLEERREIHSETVEELESRVDWYLEKLEKASRGLGAGDTREKERLKSKIDEFYSEIRGEKRQQWKDRIELEMEIQEVEKALEEVRDEDELWKLLE